MIKNLEDKIFGTDGIRGVYSKFPIVNSVLTSLCDALKQKLNVKNILIGIDTRPSGKKIFSVICEKFHDIGVNVFYAHYVTTPMISHFLYNNENSFDCGIMITASHNTHEYNGLKIFYGNGKKMNYEDEQWIEKFIYKNIEKNAVNESDSSDMNPESDLSESSDLKCENDPECLDCLKYKNIHEKVVDQYMQFIQNVVDLFLGDKSSDELLSDELHASLCKFFSQQKIFLDCANGVTSLFTKKVFSNLLSRYGPQIGYTPPQTIEEEKDFKIKPLIVESTDVENAEMLNKNASVLSENVFRSKMERVGANIGFAFDGDGDRVIGMIRHDMCDEDDMCDKELLKELKGPSHNGLNIIDGDDICAIFVRNSTLYGDNMNNVSAVSSAASSAVITLDSNSGLVNFLNASNIEYKICNVGDKNVQRSMELFNACIGTETSGHVLTKLNPFCGDGILVSVILLCIFGLYVVNESGKASHLSDFSKLNDGTDFLVNSLMIRKNPRLSLKLNCDDFERFAFSNATEIEQVANEIWSCCVEARVESRVESMVDLNDNPSFRDVYLYTIGCSVHDSDLYSDVDSDSERNSNSDCNVIPSMNYEFKSRDEVLFVAKCEVLKRKMLSGVIGNSASENDASENGVRESYRNVKKILMRPSGTEPVIRVTVECESEFLVNMAKKWFEEKL